MNDVQVGEDSDADDREDDETGSEVNSLHRFIAGGLDVCAVLVLVLWNNDVLCCFYAFMFGVLVE